MFPAAPGNPRPALRVMRRDRAVISVLSMSADTQPLLTSHAHRTGFTGFAQDLEKGFISDMESLRFAHVPEAPQVLGFVAGL